MASNEGELFHELATLHDAGLSVEQAFSKTLYFKKHPKQSSQVLKQLQRGHALSSTLFKATVISHYESSILDCYEKAGRLGVGLRIIAHHFELRVKRRANVKKRLVYPMLILFVAIAVKTIMSLLSLSPDTSTFKILSSSVLQLTFAFIFNAFLFNLIMKDSRFWLKNAWSFRVQPWYQRLYEITIFRIISHQSQSGLDFKTSFNLCAQLIRHKAFSTGLKKAATECGNGNSFVQSIIRSNLPISYELKQILKSADMSGTWHSSLEHYLVNAEDEHKRWLDSVTEWLPRVYTFFVFMVFVIPVMF